MRIHQSRGRMFWVKLLALAMHAEGKPRAGEHLRPLPAGIFLPVEMNESVRAGKIPVGTTVDAHITQRVPIGPGEYLDKRARIVGSVVSSITGQGAQPSELQIRFNLLSYRGQTVPVRVRVLAVASLMEVSATALPMSAATDRNATAASWTTRQVGGDEVYRSGWVGDVCDYVMRKVGYADFNGVYSLPAPLPDRTSALPRAMGVFSTQARGLYGFEQDATLASTDGVRDLRSTTKRAALSWGDNILLEVVQ
jgi:hypothetical protein